MVKEETMEPEVKHKGKVLPNLDGYKIILVSHSPRRRQLLEQLGLEFSVGESTVGEDYPATLRGEEIPVYLSRQKARHCPTVMDANSLIIAADTLVWLDDRPLGKPGSEEEARAMLRDLSGKEHHVITGVCVRTQSSEIAFSADTTVGFADLTDDEIDYYIRRCHPLDKAGAYGIQEWIGMIGVRYINGSFYNVMGLPVHRLYNVLKTIEPCC
jgi:septum formation protein